MKKIYTYIVLLCITAIGYSHTSKDTLAIKKGITVQPNSKVILKTRSFANLDKQIEKAYAYHLAPRAGHKPQKIKDIDQTGANLLEEAIATFEKLEETQNFIERLATYDNINTLPVGITKTIGTTHYDLGISRVTFYQNYAEMTAFVRIRTPMASGDTPNEHNQNEGNTTLFFGMDKIKLSLTGGLVGIENNLLLLQDYELFNNTRVEDGASKGYSLYLKGGFNREAGETNLNAASYVTIDCDGFKRMRLNAEVQFPRSMLEPVDQNNNVIEDPKEKVAASFQVTAENWNDILVENLNLPKFQMTSLRGFIFKINNAAFDFSDLRNPAIIFPEGYAQEGGDTADTWRGVYMQNATIILPKEFKKRSAAERLTINASNLLIDRQGVSGLFQAENLLHLNEGDASKWQFSVETLQVALVANSITGAGFAGKIVLPVSESVTENEENEVPKALAYDAVIYSGQEYKVTVSSIGREVKFDLWKAKAVINEGSYVELKVEDGNFIPKAVLTGRLIINADLDDENQASNPTEDKLIHIPNVEFTNLQVQAKQPYLQVGADTDQGFIGGAFGFGEGGQAKIANFPITISELNLRTTNNQEAALVFDLDINLMKDKIAAGTQINIKGEFLEENGIQRWKYESFSIKELKLRADLEALELEGRISFMNNDEIYGDGFKGEITTTFKKGIKVSVSSSAVFGRTNDQGDVPGFRYWYIDGYTGGLGSNSSFSKLAVSAFGGGAYYRMRRKGFGAPHTATGQDYEPDRSIGLGVKAMVAFNNKATADLFSGLAAYEVVFNDGGGMRRISYYGESHFLSGSEGDKEEAITSGLQEVLTKEEGYSGNLEAEKEGNLLGVAENIFGTGNVKGKDGIHSFVALQYDFGANGARSSLHGEVNVYFKIKGGSIKGGGPDNLAGRLEFHFEKDNWHVFLGTPETPLSLSLEIGGWTFITQGYYMVGYGIPGLAISRDNPVTKILRLSDEERQFNSRSVSESVDMLQLGKGYAYGIGYHLDTGPIDVGWYYYQFTAGFGFDLLVQDAGDAVCAHNNQPVGVNGWFMQGQLWGYVTGDFGIVVNLFFWKKRISIIWAGIAVLVRAQLPNPWWFKGYAGISYEVLGGLIKGHARVEVEFGTRCELSSGTALGGLKIIADVKPSNNATKVDVFTSPEAGFNFQINEPFEFLDDNDQVHVYKIRLDEFSAKQGSINLPGRLSWNNRKDMATFTPEDILPPEKEIKVKVRVVLEEKAGNDWKDVVINGKLSEEIEERVFTTGKAPDHIPIDNVAYSFPVVDQKYFYPNQVNQGYIQLAIGQDYLFEDNTYDNVVIFDSNGQKSKKTFSYNNNSNRITFNLPNLNNQEEYSLTLIGIPNNNNSSNLKREREVRNDDRGGDVKIRKVSIQGQSLKAEEVELLEFDFVTSRYNTFAAKINAKRQIASLFNVERVINPNTNDEEYIPDVHYLMAITDNTEPFEYLELKGSRYTGEIGSGIYRPLIAIEADLSNNRYYKDHVYPLIYDGYPLRNDFKVSRNTSVMGMPPVKAVPILTDYLSSLQNISGHWLLKERMPFRYHLPYYYKKDFVDIRYKIVNAAFPSGSETNEDIVNNPAYNRIINARFPVVKKGDYKTRIKYILPGGTASETKNYIYTFE